MNIGACMSMKASSNDILYFNFKFMYVTSPFHNYHIVNAPAAHPFYSLNSTIKEFYSVIGTLTKRKLQPKCMYISLAVICNKTLIYVYTAI